MMLCRMMLTVLNHGGNTNGMSWSKLTGHYSQHYNWNEWVDAYVVKQVIVAEMTILCNYKHATSRHWCRSCQYMQSFEDTAHKDILEDVLRIWPSYRHDAVTQIENGTDIDNAQMER